MIFLLGTLSGTLALTAAVEWSREVGIEDAIYEVREFDGYDVHYGSQKEGISSIELIFVGGESSEIRFAKSLDKTVDAVGRLERGDMVELLSQYEPKSNTPKGA